MSIKILKLQHFRQNRAIPLCYLHNGIALFCVFSVFLGCFCTENSARVGGERYNTLC